MPTATSQTTHDRLRAAREHLKTARDALLRGGANIDDPTYAPVFQGIADALELIDTELSQQDSASVVDAHTRVRTGNVCRRIREHIDTVDSLMRS